MQILPNGARYFPQLLDRDAQEHMVEIIRDVVSAAPLFVPKMPKTGKEMSVRMTNCGSLGWVTDKAHGYRYQAMHPTTGKDWPDIPQQLLDIWNEIADCDLSPEACLINFYDQSAKMGMHQDRDENNLSPPVVSISLGDTCLFRMGGTTRGGKTTSFKLQSGDAIVLSGESRMCFHGVDKLYPDSSTLLKNGGRINITMRVVN